jgi:hypothetical protein
MASDGVMASEHAKTCKSNRMVVHVAEGRSSSPLVGILITMSQWRKQFDIFRDYRFQFEMELDTVCLSWRKHHHLFSKRLFQFWKRPLNDSHVSSTTYDIRTTAIEGAND